MSFFENPTSAYQCIGENAKTLCPGHEIFNCGFHATGVACGGCFAGWYRAEGVCLPCGPLNKWRWIYPVVPCLLIPVICIVLHKINQGDVHVYGAPNNAISAAIAVSLIFFQTQGTIGDSYISFNAVVGNYLKEYGGGAADPMAKIRPECAGLWEFTPRFLVGLALPFYFLVLFFLTWLFSQCTPFPMSKDFVMGCYGGIFKTFYITVAKMCFSLFQCYSHPNGLRSMMSHSSVVCGSPVWLQNVIWALLAIFFACFCTLAGFTWAMIRAPKYFHKVSFRRRWKFLILQMRPSVYWFSLMIMIKGVWLSLTTVVINKASHQIFWLSFFMMFYLLLCATLLPWRSLVVTVIDVVCHACLVLAVLCMPFLIRPTDRPTAALEATDLFFSMTGIGLFVSFCAIVGLLVAALPMLRVRYERLLERRAAKICATLSELDHPEIMVNMLKENPVADILTLEKALLLLDNEMFGRTYTTGAGRLLARLQPREGGRMPTVDCSRAKLAEWLWM